MLEIRYLLASDIGTVISIIGIVLGLLAFWIVSEKKNFKLRLVLGGIVAIIVCLVVLNKIDMNQYTRMPYLIEKEVTEAKNILIDNNFDITKVLIQNEDGDEIEKEDCKVILQNPEVNRLVKKDTEITLTCEGTSIFEKKIIEQCKVLNRQLGDEGRSLAEEDLKAFLFMINGDYTFIDVDIFYKVLEVFAKIDQDTGNILGGITDINDHMTTISALSEAIFDERSSKYVAYWIKRYEELKTDIYENGNTDEVFSELEEFSIALHQAFVRHAPLRIGDEDITDYTLSDEIRFVVLNCVCHNIVQMLANLDGYSDGKMLDMEDYKMGHVQISVKVLKDDIENAINEAHDLVAMKIMDRTSN